ncbi:hypothetical protein SCANM124S_04177 [Streptomyces canus]
MPENGPEPWEYTLYIPNDVRAVTVARRTLRLILTMHGLIRLTDTAELLAAEWSRTPYAIRKGRPRCACAGRRGCCGSGRGTRNPNRLSRRVSWGCWGRRGGGWRWSRPARICGGGSRWPDTATGGSTCGASWRLPEPRQPPAGAVVSTGWPAARHPNSTPAWGAGAGVRAAEPCRGWGRSRTWTGSVCETRTGRRSVRGLPKGYCSRCRPMVSPNSTACFEIVGSVLSASFPAEQPTAHKAASDIDVYKGAVRIARIPQYTAVPFLVLVAVPLIRISACRARSSRSEPGPDRFLAGRLMAARHIPRGGPYRVPGRSSGDMGRSRRATGPG